MAELTAYESASGLNLFDDDRLLIRILEERLPAKGRAAALARLSKLGADCGGRLDELIRAAHEDGNFPRLERFDRWGRRVDRVVYCAEQLEARRLAFSHDCLPPVALIERMAKAYLLNQNGEGGVTCPLAMTDGLILLLEEHGTPEQKKRWLPMLRDPGTYPAFTAGQCVTERQGGSNVSENETTAEPAGDGTWRLTGLKWFCSNPGELWVTTAKPQGSDAVGLFLVPRRRLDGSLNETHILRLKDLSATRGKATAEIEYRGAYAELIGRVSHGMALLLGIVLRASRVHVAAGSLGMMRRAFVEARLYADSRRVLGMPIGAFTHARAALNWMDAAWTASMLVYFEELAALEAEDPAADVLTPLAKIHVTKLASRVVHEARLLMAGNATLRDFSILPRLAEDTLAQEIWEGTHPILAGHVLRGLRRPASRKAFFRLLDGDLPKGPAAEAVAAAKRELERLLSGGAEKTEDRGAVGLLAGDLAWRAVSLALMLRKAGGRVDPDFRFPGLAELLV
ncbi:MAG: acyl-CoA dehydrogenase family protein [Elusimicrobia bacterium]|nr:acyl-CoA dehydrogenase family protein [Elusimicrobiota bacterium]